jgi:2-polyprenyl-6-hydroxyphenyl methylase/3-demethylubiquinone-9 3-methyltransferase
MATINRTLRSFVLAIVVAENLLRWLPRGTHDWKRFVRPSEIAAMLTRHGLATTEFVGISFSPLTNRWRLSQDTSVNYMLLAVKGT